MLMRAGRGHACAAYEGRVARGGRRRAPPSLLHGAVGLSFRTRGGEVQGRGARGAER